ncbi:MAG: hypothetical protein LBT48_00350 [Prevotellaceae bacterium]|jgi:hypothetical protein|nr:hypothetical protein [Prevotellaceae bacterium]
MKKSLKMYNVIITALLAVLGFSSCKPDGGGDDDMKPAYGVPSTNFVANNATTAETEDATFVGGSEWYEGQTEQKVDISLKPEK